MKSDAQHCTWAMLAAVVVAAVVAMVVVVVAVSILVVVVAVAVLAIGVPNLPLLLAVVAAG